MNNIHEKDWAEDSWSGHTGMNSSSDYCTVSAAADAAQEDKQATDKDENLAPKQQE